MKSITQHFFEILGMRFLAKKNLKKINLKLENQEKLNFSREVAAPGLRKFRFMAH